MIKSYRGYVNNQSAILEILRPERELYLTMKFGEWNHLVVNMPGNDPNVVTAVVAAVPDVYLNQQLLLGRSRQLLKNEDNWPYNIILGGNFYVNTSVARLSLDEFLLFSRLMNATDVGYLYGSKWPCHGKRMRSISSKCIRLISCFRSYCVGW